MGYALFFVLGVVIGGISSYYLFAEHYGEKVAGKISAGVTRASYSVGAASEGIASKISNESKKL